MEAPLCDHGDLDTTHAERPEPCRMEGHCEHSLRCPACGYAFTVVPDPCLREAVWAATRRGARAA